MHPSEGHSQCAVLYSKKMAMTRHHRNDCPIGNVQVWHDGRCKFACGRSTDYQRSYCEKFARICIHNHTGRYDRMGDRIANFFFVSLINELSGRAGLHLFSILG